MVSSELKEVLSVADRVVVLSNGKVTGNFLAEKPSEPACEVYYEINRDLKSSGFICGRVTMEGSFTNGWYPDLSEFEPLHNDADLKTDYIYFNG